MKFRNFLPGLIIILSIASAAISQTGAPERKLGTRPVVIPPTDNGKNVGKAPAGPKEAPPGQRQIVSVKYIDTLPGARVTIRNVGGQTLRKTVLTMQLNAIRRYKGINPDINGTWSDISGKVPFSLTEEPVKCPWKSSGHFSLLLDKWIVMQTSVPELKAAETITMNIRFQHQGKEITSSLVDFATWNDCGISSGPSALPNYRYYIRILVDDAVGGAYLYPATN